MSDSPPDQAQREQALDPARSIIVQAPAGSGKTELLTQRFLRLLALVEQPEEIAAITFTRKAATEMRNRVLGALDSAEQPRPQEAHKQHTWELARAAAAQDHAQGWQLRQTPSRLRIKTFDSLAAELTRQMPLLAELGAPPDVQDDASPLYRQAARATLKALEEPELQPHLACVLRHLDNRLGQLEELIGNLLGKRDQWLSHVLKAGSLASLQQALRDEIQQRLLRLHTSFPPDVYQAVLDLAPVLAQRVPETKRTGSKLIVWAEQENPPQAQWEDLPLWLGLRELLLTKGGDLRKRVDASIGVLAPSEKGIHRDEKALRTQTKQQVQALIEQVGQHSDLIEQLAKLGALPTSGFSDDQALVLEGLRHCLLRAAAELRLVFAERGAVDYSELGLRALHALGDPDYPTDLALALDYRLKHLLVDEFQDTSSNQHALLKLLTANWQAQDQHSLLLVGDPMQSIYRFREAEVGLYLRTRERGLGDLALQPLTLTMNFRSQAGIVAWVNHYFSRLFPTHADAVLGAVSYSDSIAFHPTQSFSAVQVHGRLGRDDVGEAQQIADLIEQTLVSYPQQDIAVLGRGRSHLTEIALALQARGIRFAAVDINPLSSRPVVQDLRTLTRALLHPADRLAWLALLRAPWLGLELSDLLHLAEGSTQVIWQRLQDASVLNKLSTRGQSAIRRLIDLLDSELPARGRLPLRSWIEGIWLALGGLAVAGAAALEDAMAYLNLVEQLEQAGSQLDFAELDRRTEKLYAAPDNLASGQVKMMTMHAAKGLEFDTVILPGLGRRSRGMDSELLYWAETPAPQGGVQLLMAPIRSRTQQAEPIGDFIRGLNKEKEQFEVVRLLYVAATRARQRLHLFGHADSDQKTHEPKPPSGSLLATLWPVVAEAFAGLTVTEPATSAGDLMQPAEQCLAADWRLQLPQSAPTTSRSDSAKSETEATDIDYLWAGDTARHVGTLVHRYLERIASQGLDQWPPERIETLQGQLLTGLAALGVAPAERAHALRKCQRALVNALRDSRGQWILTAHAEHACELPMTLHAESFGHYVLDRTFVDTQGTRWIIDYKTGDLRDDDVESFLDNELERYRSQLENYAYILNLAEHRPIKLGLYFPLLKGWRSWDYAPAEPR